MGERRWIWRAADANLFRFTVTDLRELHIALMAAFEETAVLVPALNFDRGRALQHQDQGPRQAHDERRVALGLPRRTRRRRRTTLAQLAGATTGPPT